jgi:hypothetical protein
MQGDQRSTPGRLSLVAGYFPLLVVGALVVAMVYFVPSEVPDGASSQAGAAGETETEDIGTTASGWGETVEPCGEGGPQDDVLDYAPPCLTFTGDTNGGETSTGVSEDTIRVSYRNLETTGHFLQTLSQIANADMGESAEDLWRTAEALVEYFNENFEFYGREIELARFDGAGDLLQELFGAGQEDAGVDGRRAAEQDVFADAMAVSQPYAEELAAEEIVNIGAPYMSRDWFDERWPYSWSPFPDCTLIIETAADLMTERLLDQPVVLGDAEGEPRVLGGVHPSNDQYQACGDDFEERVSGEGFDIAERQTYPMDIGQAGNNASSILDNLIRDGVTSVGFVGDPMTLDALVAQAEQRNYNPEWIVGGVGFNDMDMVGQMMASDSGDQWANAFGVTPTGSPLSVGEMDAYQAFKSVRPDEEPTQALEFMYSLLLPLAIGIEMAGPDLTPETFAEGLYRYPATEGWMGTLDYSPDSHSGRIDVRFMFWDADAASPFNGQPGTWKDTGDRFTEIGQAPTQEELFAEAQTILDEP